MAKQEIKALAYAESKKEKQDFLPPKSSNILDYTYFLGCLFAYRYAQHEDVSTAREWMQELDKLYDEEFKRYPNWSAYYENNKGTSDAMWKLNELFTACCDNAENCKYCKAVKDWE